MRFGATYRVGAWGEATGVRRVDRPAFNVAHK
jgi:hypothetical protein